MFVDGWEARRYWFAVQLDYVQGQMLLMYTLHDPLRNQNHRYKDATWTYAPASYRTPERLAEWNAYYGVKQDVYDLVFNTLLPNADNAAIRPNQSAEIYFLAATLSVYEAGMVHQGPYANPYDLSAQAWGQYTQGTNLFRSGDPLLPNRTVPGYLQDDAHLVREQLTHVFGTMYQQSE